MALETLTLGEAIIARAAIAAAAALALTSWFRRVAANTASDPWDQDIDAAVKDQSAVPVCVNCLFPQRERSWLCPHCAFPSGDYVTLMPYLQNFAMGELFRKGVIGPPEKGAGRKAFLVIYSAAEYGGFAPVYWYWMIRKAKGKPICYARRDDPTFEDDA